jgi:hypothetical protein
LRRRDSKRASSPPYKQAFDAVADRYNLAKAEASEDVARDEAEHAA